MASLSRLNVPCLSILLLALTLLSMQEAESKLGSTEISRGQLKALLIIGPKNWAMAAIYVSLDMAGFEVSVVIDGNSPEYTLAKASSQHVKRAIACKGTPDSKCILDAILKCQPHVVFSTIDKTTLALIEIEEHLLNGQINIPPHLANFVRDVLKKSLPAPEYRRILLNKASVIHDVAYRNLSLPVPEFFSASIDKLRHIYSLAKENKTLPFELPVVLKASKGVAGSGVHLLRTMEELQSVVQGIIQNQGKARGLIGSAGGKADFHIEQLVHGPTCLLALCSWQGEAIAAFPVCKNLTKGEVCFTMTNDCAASSACCDFTQLPVLQTGSSLTNAPIANPDMVEIGRRLMRGMGYSGFANLDFVIDDKTGRPYLIDFNPRLTTGHILNMREAGSLPLNLVEALYIRMLGISSPKLGFHAPRDVGARTAPLFVKLEYLRGFDSMTDLLFDERGLQNQQIVINSPPWCDNGMMRVFDQHLGVHMDQDTCTIKGTQHAFVDHVNCPCHLSSKALPYDV